MPPNKQELLFYFVLALSILNFDCCFWKPGNAKVDKCKFERGLGCILQENSIVPVEMAIFRAICSCIIPTSRKFTKTRQCW